MSDQGPRPVPVRVELSRREKEFGEYAKRVPYQCALSWFVRARQCSCASDSARASCPPQWLRDNRYLRTHFRPQLSPLQALRSVLQLHNESFNIWSHLLGALYFVRLFRRYRAHDALVARLGRQAMLGKGVFKGGRTPAAVYLALAGSILCYTTSATAHTFCCCSERACRLLFSFDKASIVAMFATYVVACCLARWDREHAQTRLISVVGSSVVGILATVIAVLPSSSKTLVCAALGTEIALSAIPFVTELYLSLRAEPDFVRRLVTIGVSSYACAITGGVLYAAEFPEHVRRWWGKFDLIGNGHNLMHVCGVAASHFAVVGLAYWSGHTRKRGREMRALGVKRLADLARAKAAAKY